MFENAIRQHGVDFKLSREGAPDRMETGIKTREESSGRRFIGFIPGTDVKAGDTLLGPSGETYYVIETDIQYARNKVIQVKAFIQNEQERNSTNQPSAAVFNIQNAYGSVIGTNNQATINYNSAVSELKERVASDTSEDKEQLEKIVSLLEMVVNDQVPPSKGLFSKFSEVMERHSWISGSVAGAILSWLTSGNL